VIGAALIFKDAAFLGEGFRLPFGFLPIVAFRYGNKQSLVFQPLLLSKNYRIL